MRWSDLWSTLRDKPALSSAQVQSLYMEWKGANDPLTRRRLRERLHAALLRWTYGVVQARCGQLRNLHVNDTARAFDLVSAAHQGQTEAVDSYRPATKVPLTAWVVKRVQFALMGVLPESQLLSVKKKTAETLAAVRRALGQCPTTLSAQEGVRLANDAIEVGTLRLPKDARMTAARWDTLCAAAWAGRVSSLNSTVEGAEGGRVQFGEVVAFEGLGESPFSVGKVERPHEALESAELRAILEEALHELSPREQRTLRLHFGLEETPGDAPTKSDGETPTATYIAEQVGCQDSAVAKILRRAPARLREKPALQALWAAYSTPTPDPIPTIPPRA